MSRRSPLRVSDAVRVDLPPQVELDASDLPVGAILIRRYKGEEHMVLVLDPIHSGERARRRGWWRYEYNGRRYKTLSAIAYEITGDRYMSGNRFFGLRLRRRECRRQVRRWNGMG